LVSLAVMPFGGCGKKDIRGDADLLVYIPCGLTIPMKAALEKFRAENPDSKVKDELDSGVVLVRRIIDKGERPDVLLLPGYTEMGIVEKAGLIDQDRHRSFGAFELCIIVPKKNPGNINSFEDIVKARPLSCPDPKINSSGAAAKEALTELGLWDALQDNIRITEIAHSSHNDVAGGKAQAGVCFKACPLDTAPEKLSKSKVTIAADFPKGTYEQPRVEIAALNTTEVPEAAQAFIDFILRDDVQDLLREKKLPGLMGEMPSAAEIRRRADEYEKQLERDKEQAGADEPEATETVGGLEANAP